MIRTVAELLLRLKDEEARKLADFDLSHGPTIGNMYEGLSQDILRKSIPEELDLRVVEGFITDGQGGQSGQIDCMIVTGSGESIPYTDKYIWHIRNVVAAFEIKKTLYKNDLIDAFQHLSDLRQLESRYLQSGADSSDLSLGPAFRAFAQMTGKSAPPLGQPNDLSVHESLLLNAMVMERVGLIRVVLGYGGYKSEAAFRKALADYLIENLNVRGFGPLAFPQLIVSGDFSLVKANGLPYVAIQDDGRWPFCLSSSLNPLRFLLEFLWTRLGQKFNASFPWGDDLDMEGLNLFLVAEGVKAGEKSGWQVEVVAADEAKLKDNAGGATWEPVTLSEDLLRILDELCNERPVEMTSECISRLLGRPSINVDDLKVELLATRLVAMSGDSLELITEQLEWAYLPDGRVVAGDNNTGRLTRWVERNFGPCIRLVREEQPTNP